MNIPNGFLDEEIRSDFTVTSRRKRLWQIQIELLMAVDEICRRHDIKYFAMGGTLLGAIRHGGYIPWDDDIDLAMTRDEYDRFIEAAQTELKHPFFLQSAFTEKDYAISHIKIRNSESTGAARFDFEFEYNKGVFIDVFPVDNIPDDPDKKRELLAGVTRYRRIFDVGLRKFWYVGDEIITDEEKKELKDHIQERGLQTVYREFDAFCSSYNKTKTKECGVLALELTSERFFWNCDDIEDIIYADFEYVKIPIPKNYDRILKKTYGDYMKPVKGGALHGNLIFDPDVSYKEYCSDNISEELVLK